MTGNNQGFAEAVVRFRAEVSAAVSTGRTAAAEARARSAAFREQNAALAASLVPAAKTEPDDDLVDRRFAPEEDDEATVVELPRIDDEDRRFSPEEDDPAPVPAAAPAPTPEHLRHLATEWRRERGLPVADAPAPEPSTRASRRRDDDDDFSQHSILFPG